MWVLPCLHILFNTSLSVYEMIFSLLLFIMLFFLCQAVSAWIPLAAIILQYTGFSLGYGIIPYNLQGIHPTVGTMNTYTAYLKKEQ